MSKQNNISDSYNATHNLQAREVEVLQDACAQTHFVVDKLINRSSWWGSKAIGAFHYAGTHKGKPAVLKVQGVKPAFSEAQMIRSFKAHNKSGIIRPPDLYAWEPWDDAKGYEALVLEDVPHHKVVNKPTDEAEVARFFELYREYRTNCRSVPWVERPSITIAAGIEKSHAKWHASSLEIYPKQEFRVPEDELLLQQALKTLQDGYANVALEFVHGHFSADDLYRVGSEAVVLSNLYWSWRPPFYDAVFAYHWFMYGLGSREFTLTAAEIDAQRALWLNAIYKLPANGSSEERRLLNLALLERAAAGLLLDALTVDPQGLVAEYLVAETRREVYRLVKLLK